MRIPSNSFDADDKAVCRAHSEAVEQDHYSRMLVVEVVQEPEFRRSGRAVLPADLPLPPSYDADLAKWRSCLSGNSKSEHAAWEWWAVSVCPSGDVEDVHAQWLKSSNFDDWFAENLGSSSVMKRRHTPAGGSAKQPEPAADVWHSELPAVAGIYVASAMCDQESCRWFDGAKWHEAQDYCDRDQCRGKPETSVQSIKWLCLIEAEPAKPVQQAQATYSVCIKAYTAHGRVRSIGGMLFGGPNIQDFPDNWLPCDKDGWVSHEPRADSVCPVPGGVAYVARYRYGGKTYPVDADRWTLGTATHREPNSYDIVAWRPTGAAA